MNDKKPEPEVFAIVEHEPGMLTRRSFVKAAIGLSAVGALSTLSADAQAVQSVSGRCDKGVLAHSKAVTPLTGNPVSECFVSVGQERVTKIWNASQRALLRTFKASQKLSTFTLEGKRLFVPQSNTHGSTTLSLPDGSELAVSGSDLAPRCLAMSPDGKMLAAIDEDGSLSFFNAETGMVLRNMHGGEPPNEIGHTSDGKLPSPRGLWFSSNGEMLLLLDVQRRLWWVNYFDDSPARRALLEFPVSTSYPQLSAGNRLVQQADDRGIVWIQIEHGQNVERLEAPSGILKIALSRDGSKVAGILQNGRVAVWKLGEDPTPEIHRPSRKSLSLIEFGKDSDSLLLGVDEKKLGYYNIPSKRMVGLYSGGAYHRLGSGDKGLYLPHGHGKQRRSSEGDHPHPAPGKREDASDDPALRNRSAVGLRLHMQLCCRNRRLQSPQREPEQLPLQRLPFGRLQILLLLLLLPKLRLLSPHAFPLK